MITRAWWILIITTIVVGVLGLFLMYVLTGQIEAEDPIVERFTPTDVFVQPDAEWNTSILEPRSPESREIRKLSWLVFAIAVGIFVVVEGLLVYAIIRYRRRKGDPEDTREPVQLYGSNPVEIAWTVIPIIIVLVLCLATIRTIQTVQPTKGERPENALTVEVIGHRWWWEFRYPELNVVTANELFIPVERPIWLEITSADVIHSFWVPELQGKMDAIPAHTNYWKMTAEEEGTYLGQCAEYCGNQHANMLIRVEVLDADGFGAWAQQQALPAVVVDTEEVNLGREVFMKYACQNCHAIAGLCDGTYAPDLTHLMSRVTFAGGMIPNTEANLKAWIDDPQQIKPGCDMPALKLSTKEIEQVVAYLVTLK
ncbi:MAG: cytochrome c oxidase subunit II [Planctomycetota bacterium]|nr:cytochrome c oxidase subunit II [Phycisphaerales bacterium]MEE2681872.1 cytochrome c oxidase subunit II [Planctomycetota bacterium]